MTFKFPRAQIVFTITAALLLAADWPQFRGPDASSVADADLPTDWSDGEHVQWKVDLSGRGASSPIIIDGRVIVTASSGYRHDRLHVLCFDLDSGERLWDRTFWATGRTATHSSISCAAPTPASDGRSIFAFFSSNDLICLDLDGNLRWYRGLAFDFPKTGNDIGMSSSPVVVDGVVVVQMENQGDSFAAGIDAETGETRWRVERPNRANWASPIVLPGAGERPAAVLLQSVDRMTAHDVQTGEVLWQMEVECATIPSSTVSGDVLFAPTAGLTALRLSDQSNTAEILWDSNRMRPGSSSPVVHDGRVYTESNGIVKCADVQDGEIIWTLRLKGRHWATPVIAGGHMFCINADGEAHVVRLGETEGEVVSSGSFGEVIQGSPAVADNAMVVRSDQHLWKISK